MNHWGRSWFNSFNEKLRSWRLWIVIKSEKKTVLLQFWLIYYIAFWPGFDSNRKITNVLKWIDVTMARSKILKKMKLFEFCVCKASCGPLNLKHVTCCHGDFPIRSRALISLRHDTIPWLKLLNESSWWYIGIFLVCNELDFIQVTGSVPLLFKWWEILGEDALFGANWWVALWKRVSRVLAVVQGLQFIMARYVFVFLCWLRRLETQKRIVSVH